MSAVGRSHGAITRLLLLLLVGSNCTDGLFGVCELKNCCVDGLLVVVVVSIFRAFYFLFFELLFFPFSV